MDSRKIIVSEDRRQGSIYGELNSGMEDADGTCMRLGMEASWMPRTEASGGSNWEAAEGKSGGGIIIGSIP